MVNALRNLLIEEDGVKVEAFREVQKRPGLNLVRLMVERLKKEGVGSHEKKLALDVMEGACLSSPESRGVLDQVDGLKDVVNELRSGDEALVAAVVGALPGLMVDSMEAFQRFIVLGGLEASAAAWRQFPAATTYVDRGC